MSGLAAGLIALSAVLHACWNFAARKVSGDLGAIWLGLTLACLVALPVAALIGGAWKPALPFMAASGAVQAAYFVLLAKAYETGEVGVVYPVARGTGVLGTAVLASALLGERAGPGPLAGIACVVLGVFALARASHQGSAKALPYALATGATISVYSLLDKRGVALANPFLYISGLFFIYILLLTPYMLAFKKRELRRAWRERRPAAVFIGLSAFSTYLLVLFAFRLAPVSLIVPFRELSVVIGAILGAVFLREAWSARKTVGLAAVAAGLILIKLG